MDWLSVFDESTPEPGASAAEIERFVATVGLPLSEAEIDEVNRSQRNPFHPTQPLHAAYRPFDPSRWVPPARPLPPAYIDFLRWSNGGWFRTGEREFGFFPAGDVRGMMLGYHLPEYMPGAVPIAFDGGGIFYLFDLRQPAVGGEYPVVCAHAGHQGWGPDACRALADTFLEACRGTVAVWKLWHDHQAGG